jgi:serralysin
VTRFSTSTVLVMGFWAGCSAGPEPLTYEEFEARAYREPETGLRIFNGDELVENEEAMAALYESYLTAIADAADREAGLATVEQGLAVNRVNGQDDKWPASVAQNITYCISSTSFGNRYNTVVSAMASASAAWETAAGGGVNFVHVPGEDATCSTRTSVVFNVRQVTTSQYIARAFFPSTARKARELLVSSNAFGNIYPWSVAGVMRHELGHVLGFRHEHTRPEAGTCFEDTSWRALTAYDSASVMHYPACNGTQGGDLVLTALDQIGVDGLY